METSTGRDNHNQPSFLPSPTGHGSSSSTATSNCNCSTTAAATNNNNNNRQPSPPLPSPKPITRSEQANPYPTTFVQADTSSFKQVVQMLTGSPRTTVAAAAQRHHPDPPPKSSHAHNIPPLKTTPKKNQSAGFKLYERRNSLKNFNINPLNPILAPPSSGFSPRKPEILSPSNLDFPALALSPVTPLIPDPFDRSGAANYASCHSPSNHHNNSSSSSNNNNRDTDAEDREIKEKGFYLHPSPATTPREAEPRLLLLFPMTSPSVSGSVNNP